jgi:hypothetical protein
MADLTVKTMVRDIKKIETEAVIAGFYEDVRPLKGVAGELDWLLCGTLSSLIIAKKLTGALGEIALVTSQGKIAAQKIFLVGLGRRTDLTVSSLQSAAKSAAVSAIGTGITKASIEYFQAADIPVETLVPAIRNGLREGTGGRGFDVVLLAPDRATCDRITACLPAQA